MKILVTGATGRVGANLVLALLDAGHDVRSFVYPGDASRAHKLDGFDRVETVTGDLRSFDDVRAALRGVDAVYHIAAAFAAPFNHREYLDINANGTLNLLEAIREELPGLHRFAYACTEAVYWEAPYRGRYFEEPITEEMTAEYCDMPYFMTKRIGEELTICYQRQYGVPACVFRFATIIEPSEFLDEGGRPYRFFLSDLYERCRAAEGKTAEEREMYDHIRSLWKGEEKLVVLLNPNGVPQKQPFADVRDIAGGLLLGLEREEAVGEIFNLGGAVVFDWGEAIPFLAERYGMEYVEAKVPTPNYFDLDLGKINRLLGFEPKYDLLSLVETAEALHRGEDAGVIPTGVRYG